MHKPSAKLIALQPRYRDNFVAGHTLNRACLQQLQVLGLYSGDALIARLEAYAILEHALREVAAEKQALDAELANG